MASYKKIFFTLEDRIVLDAAAVATTADVIDDFSSPSESQAVEESLSGDALGDIADSATPLTYNRIVIVDERADEKGEIANYLKQRGVEVHLIGVDQDGVSAIGEILSQYESVDTVDIISHGSEGSVELGNAVLSSESFDAYLNAVKSWSQSLTEDADILLYGCDVSSSGEGEYFIQRLAEATGADIAASDDVTGQGGDWELEYLLGDVTASEVIESDADLDVTLNMVKGKGETIVITAPYSGQNFRLDVLANETAPGPLTIDYMDVVYAPGTGEAQFHNSRTGIGFTSDGSLGDFKIDYEFTDKNGQRYFAQLYLCVMDGEQQNVAPEARNDSITYDFDRNRGAYKINVLDNDRDVNGDTLRIVSISSPQNGTVVNVQGRQISYTPTEEFNGVDTFSYVVADEQGAQSTATVTVTGVNAAEPNLPPNATNDNISLLAGGKQTVNVLDNDTDPDGDSLEVVSVSSAGKGTVVHKGDGEVEYTSNGTAGRDSFTYVVKDPSGATSEATVEVVVNELEILSSGDDVKRSLRFEVFEDKEITIDATQGLPSKDFGLERPERFIDDNNWIRTKYDNLDINVDSRTGKIIIDPDRNFNGIANFSYIIKVYETGERIQVEVEVNVLSVNDAPGNGVGQFPANFLTNSAQNPDVQNANARVGDVDHAYETLVFNGFVDIDYTGQNGPLVKENTIDLQFGRMTYVPETRDFEYVLFRNGDDVPEGSKVVGIEDTVSGLGGRAGDFFAYEFKDPEGLIGRTQISINIENVEAIDVFEASFVSADVEEDSSLDIDLFELGNEKVSVAEGDSFQFALSNNSNVPNSLGGKSIDIPGVGQAEIDDDGLIKFTPNQDFNTGNPSNDVVFYYQVSNGTEILVEEVSIAINPVNDAPFVADIEYKIIEDSGSNVINVLDSQAIGDVDGDNLTFEIISNDITPLQGQLSVGSDGVITFTPALNYNGVVNLVYRVVDSNGLASDNANLKIVVDEKNDPPFFSGDSVRVTEDVLTLIDVSSLVSDDDIGDSNKITLPGEVTEIQTSQGGTVTLDPITGEVEYISAENFNGNDTFDVIATDSGGLSVRETIKITVEAENDAPVVINSSVEVLEDSEVDIDVLSNSTDVDDTSLTVVIDTQPSNGTLVLNPDGSFKYKPNANFNGSDSFSYRVNDGELDSNVATISILVKSDNDAPVASDLVLEVKEDTDLVIDLFGSSSDDDGDDLQLIIVSQPSNGTLINNNGTITYVPNANFSGDDSFSYKFNDGKEDSNVAQVSLKVTEDNDAPIAADINVNVIEDSGLTVVDVLRSDSVSDVEDSNLTLNIVSTDITPAKGSLNVSSNGNIEFTPAPNYNGVVSIFYTVTDTGGLDSNQAKLEITVSERNDPPVFNSNEVDAFEDTPITIDVPSLVSDDDIGDVKKITLPGGVLELSTPQGGKVTLDPVTGLVTYEPKQDFNGEDSFKVIATDSAGASTEDIIKINVGNVNDAPTASAFTVDGIVVEDGGPYAIDVFDRGNVVDVDGDNLTLEILTSIPQSQGELINQGDGVIVFNPAPNFNGDIVVQYRVTDGNLPSETVSMTIKVASENDAPIANSFTVNGVVEDSDEVTIDLFTRANVSDVDNSNDDLSLIFSPIPASQGTLTDGGSGKLIFKPAENFNGTISVSYSVTDGSKTSPEATMTIVVGAQNDAPIANNFSVVNEISEDSSEVVLNVFVRGNVSDVDNNNSDLSLSFDSIPANQGTLSDRGNGRLAFTPAPNFNGTIDVTYRISDGNLTSSDAIMSIVVAEVNDAPTANNIFVQTDEDTSQIIDAIGNSNDIEGTSLSVSIPSNGQPANGTVQVNQDGTIIYTPNANFFGNDSFNYQVNDGNLTSEIATVSITVSSINDIPQISPVSVSVDEDSAPVLIDVFGLGNASDADNDNLTLTVDPIPASQGVITNNNDGTITFIPAVNFNGTIELNYIVNDGQTDSEPAELKIIVGSKNDDPFFKNNIVNGVEDTNLPINIISLIQDNDVGDTQTVSLRSGQLTEATSGGTITLDPATGQIVYQPKPNFNGSDTFVVTVTDSNGGSATETITINVAARNDKPVSDNFDISVNEDSSQNEIDVFALGGVSDVDNDALTLEVLTAIPINQGVLEDIGGGKVRFTPAANFNGDVQVQYRVSDGSLNSDIRIMNIEVLEDNDAPVASDIAIGVDEDQSVVIDAIANSSDVEGSNLIVSIVNQPSNGSAVVNDNGTITYTPNTDFNGTETFSYKVNDGSLDSAVAQIVVAVSPLNDSPVASDINVDAVEDTEKVIDIIGNSSDVDQDNLTISIPNNGQPSNGTIQINGNGTITYTPNPNYNGTDSFKYQVTDDGEGNLVSNEATVVINVASENDFPEFNDLTFNTNEDVPVQINPLDNIADSDGDDLVISIPVNGNPNSGSVSVDGDGVITYTPNNNFNGQDNFEYRVTDGTEVATIQVTINVGQVNDKPQAGDINQSLAEDTSAVIDAIGNSSDLDGDTLTVIIPNGGQPANGTIVVNPNGTITYTPDADYNGTDIVRYRVSDGTTLSDIATVNLTIEADNDFPTFDDLVLPTEEETPLVIEAIQGKIDVDGDNLIVSIPQDLVQPQKGQIVLNPNGTITYTPALNQVNQDSFQYRVTDGTETQIVNVVVNIGNSNDMPTANNILVENVQEDDVNGVVVNTLANSSDPDNDPLTISIPSGGQPANGTITVNADGTVRYIPNADFNGTDTFRYQASDGTTFSNIATVTVIVDPTNDDPEAGDGEFETPEDVPIDIVIDSSLFSLNSSSDFSLLTSDKVVVFDKDGDPLTIEITEQPKNGTASINADGTFRYVPNQNFNGIDSFVYKVTDDKGAFDTGVITVTVGEVNDEPIQTDVEANVNEDSTVVIPILSNVTDVDNDSLTIIEVSEASNGIVEISGEDVIYTPNLNFNGRDVFTVTVSDGKGGLVTGVVGIDVGPVNDTPEVVVIDGLVANQNQILNFNLNDVVLFDDVDFNDSNDSVDVPNSGANDDPISINNEVEITLNAKFGDIFVTNTQGVDVEGNNTGTITIRGGLESVRSSIQTLGYLTNAFGDSSIEITVNDLGNGGIDPESIDLVGTGGIGQEIASSTINLTVQQTEFFDYLEDSDYGTLNIADVDNGFEGIGENRIGFGSLPNLHLDRYEPNDMYELRLVYALPDVVYGTEAVNTFAIPEGSFEHSDSNTDISYKAYKVNGSELPNWISFDGERKEFTLSATGEESQNLEVLVVAEDDNGNEANATFTVVLVEGDYSPGNNNFVENEREVEIDELAIHNTNEYLDLDEEIEALLEEMDFYPANNSDDGIVPFSQQLKSNLRTSIDEYAIELVKDISS